jgi:hypothetical protein
MRMFEDTGKVLTQINLTLLSEWKVLILSHAVYAKICIFADYVSCVSNEFLPSLLSNMIEIFFFFFAFMDAGYCTDKHASSNNDANYKNLNVFQCGHIHLF